MVLLSFSESPDVTLWINVEHQLSENWISQVISEDLVYRFVGEIQVVKLWISRGYLPSPALGLGQLFCPYCSCRYLIISGHHGGRHGGRQDVMGDVGAESS